MMQKFKVYIRKIIYISFGVFDVVFGRKPEIFILCYHSIANDAWRFGISLNNLEKQLSYLAKNFSSISLQDVEDVIRGKKKINKPSFVITFDDGYKEVLKVRSLVKKYQIKPALFILSDTKNPNYKELDTKREFLNKEDILLLMREGWTIGSHGATHSDFWKLNKNEIDAEVITPKNIFKKIYGKSIKYFAYPKGRYTQKIINAVKSAGYSLAFSMDDGSINSKTNYFAVPRIGVDRTHTFSEFKTLFSPSCIAFRKFIKEHVGVIV